MNLRELRTKSGMTQAELASRVGKRQNTVAQWELGVRQPRMELLPKLAEVLGCTIDELLRTEPKKENPA